MGFFTSREEKHLDELIGHVEVNMSNNYKDAAQEDFKELESFWGEVCTAGVLKDRTLLKYEQQIADYLKRLVGYTHKDQKPYWT